MFLQLEHYLSILIIFFVHRLLPTQLSDTASTPKSKTHSTANLVPRQPSAHRKAAAVKPNTPAVQPNAAAVQPNAAAVQTNAAAVQPNAAAAQSIARMNQQPSQAYQGKQHLWWIVVNIQESDKITDKKIKNTQIKKIK